MNIIPINLKIKKGEKPPINDVVILLPCKSLIISKIILKLEFILFKIIN